ncbi:hypothetical protein [Paractinoplanes rishiriensis]|uniref:Secreted protein n=1 Tax=Paractinoplanes rishiriensis TaxID=1050105 RepID=A0A919JXT4_9ACTN|nr:hypothetical protein [Actinoplanes rishiriensis]GIE97201.1 hypothetical protein Ari01nite_46660 [Actinoplanes rishiriensis]
MLRRITIGTAALLALAACGPAKAEPQVATAVTATAPAPSAPAAAGDKDRALDFVKCMRAEGVQVADPDPQGNWAMQPGDKTDPDFPDAMQKCKALRPDVRPDGSAGLTEEQAATLRRFAQCMRDNGVPDFADPGPNGFDVPPKDAAAAKRAQQTCLPILGADPDGPVSG